MNSRDVISCLQALNWEERYDSKPLKKYYLFRVATTRGSEYFYVDRAKPNAMLYLDPRFLEWSNEFRGCDGVEIGGAKGSLLLKHADMRKFPTTKGGTGDDIPQCFPLRFRSKEALLRATTVIAEKAGFTVGANPQEDDTSAVIDSEVPNTGNEVVGPSSQGKRRSISESDLLDILNRQRENGAAGERIVFEWEKKRLKDCGCASPDDFVTHTSKNNVAAGFDIHSHWSDDHERFIEVKTTASGADYFFMSQNEKEVLTKKAGKAYVYIVDLESSGKDSGTVRDPVRFAEAALEFEPVAYRVHLTK